MSDKATREICSFCGKTKEEAVLIITTPDGTSACICDKCILKCVDIYFKRHIYIARQVKRSRWGRWRVKIVP